MIGCRNVLKIHVLINPLSEVSDTGVNIRLNDPGAAKGVAERLKSIVTTSQFQKAILFLQNTAVSSSFKKQPSFLKELSIVGPIDTRTPI